MKQNTFKSFEKHFLAERVRESIEIIKRIPKPIVVQFSGGKDSTVLLHLVKEVTNDFVCGYCDTGIAFAEAREMVEKTADLYKVEIIISEPRHYKGGFFERLPQFGWPTIKKSWCNRDLKVRPQKKLFEMLYGKVKMNKLVAVRRFESNRRHGIYKVGEYTRPDYNVASDDLWYPVLDWTDADIANYIRKNNIPVMKAYKDVSVSGCYWCPFYTAGIYKKIIKAYGNMYEEFIKWEQKLGPSVIGHVWLSDLIED